MLNELKNYYFLISNGLALLIILFENVEEEEEVGYKPTKFSDWLAPTNGIC